METQQIPIEIIAKRIDRLPDGAWIDVQTYHRGNGHNNQIGAMKSDFFSGNTIIEVTHNGTINYYIIDKEQMAKVVTAIILNNEYGTHINQSELDEAYVDFMRNKN